MAGNKRGQAHHQRRPLQFARTHAHRMPSGGTCCGLCGFNTTATRYKCRHTWIERLSWPTLGSSCGKRHGWRVTPQPSFRAGCDRPPPSSAGVRFPSHQYEPGAVWGAFTSPPRLRQGLGLGLALAPWPRRRPRCSRGCAHSPEQRAVPEVTAAQLEGEGEGERGGLNTQYRCVGSCIVQHTVTLWRLAY